MFNDFHDENSHRRPHWMHRHGGGGRRPGRMEEGREEPRRRGGGGPFGRGGGRVFGPGDLRLVLLAMIAEKPRHGYELIKELEQKFGGA